jgi:hypothetical protein
MLELFRFEILYLRAELLYFHLNLFDISNRKLVLDWQDSIILFMMDIDTLFEAN